MRKLAVILALCMVLDLGLPQRQKKLVALTFDDGPTGKYTSQLLELLEEKKVKATFFLCGYRIEQYPELTAQLAQQGHELGLHGWQHAYFSELSEEALAQELTQESFHLAEITGQTARLVRPPGGLLPKKGSAALQDYAVILWSVDPNDWATDARSTIVQRVVSKVQPGDIILMHDASTSSVEAAGEIIDCLRGQGYVFVTVSELAEAYGTAPERGECYRRFP